MNKENIVNVVKNLSLHVVVCVIFMHSGSAFSAATPSITTGPSVPTATEKLIVVNTPAGLKKICVQPGQTIADVTIAVNKTNKPGKKTPSVKQELFFKKLLTNPSMTDINNVQLSPTMRVSDLHSDRFPLQITRPSYEAAVHQIKNEEGKPLEDRFIMQKDFFGVFDGNGGHDVSHYISEKLYSQFIYFLPAFPKDPHQALIQAFEATNNRVAHDNPNAFLNQGSTAVVAYIQDGIIHVANVGDSRVALCTGNESGNTTTPLSIDQKAVLLESCTTPKCAHKECIASETQRIMDADGQVKFIKDAPRVVYMYKGREGGLICPRNFGNRKAAGMIATPVVTKHRITPDDKFLIIASDGLWDVWNDETSKKIIDYIVNSRNARHTLEAIAQGVAQGVHNFGMNDDITVMIVDLQPQQSLPA